MFLPYWAVIIAEFMVIANAVDSWTLSHPPEPVLSRVTEKWISAVTAVLNTRAGPTKYKLALSPLPLYPELESPSITSCRTTTDLESLLCCGTEQIEGDGVQALTSPHNSLKNVVEDTQGMCWTCSLFSHKITRCLIFILSTCRLNLVLFVQI